MKLPTTSRATIAIAVAAIITSIASMVFAISSRPTAADTMAFVRIDAVFAQYAGMKDVQSVLEAKHTSWQSEIDTLQSDYRNTVATLGRDYKSLPFDERKRLEELVSVQEHNLTSHASSLSNRMQEEREKLLSGVMNQLNAAISSYATEHDLAIVFGINGDGSILYGRKALDITDQIVADLNRTYAPHDRTELQ